MRLISKIGLVAASVLGTALPAFAEEAAAGSADGSGLRALAAGLAIGVAALGGALGQGKIIATAVESIARNPGAAGEMRLPWLLGIVFVETLVIYALVIALGLS